MANKREERLVQEKIPLADKPIESQPRKSERELRACHFADRKPDCFFIPDKGWLWGGFFAEKGEEFLRLFVGQFGAKGICLAKMIQ